MKTKIFVVVLIFLIMGTVPVVTILGDAPKNISKNQETTATTKPIDTEKLTDEEIIKGQIFAVYDNEYNFETLKALAVIFRNNLKADKNSVDIKNKDIYISYEEFKNKNSSFEEINKQIDTAVNDTKSIYIYDNDKVAYIPYSKCSNGSTETSENHPDLINVASPWDKLSKNFSADNSCVGVSIDGINFLTENNNNYLTALQWYLPKYKIQGWQILSAFCFKN